MEGGQRQPHVGAALYRSGAVRLPQDHHQDPERSKLEESFLPQRTQEGVEVEVLDLMDGRTVLHHQGAFHKLVRVEEEETKKTLAKENTTASSTEEGMRKPCTPGPDHPWKSNPWGLTLGVRA